LGRYNERVNYQHVSAKHLYKDIEEELIRSTSNNGYQQVDQSVKGIDQATATTTIEHNQNRPENDQLSNQDDQPDQITASETESVATNKIERAPSVEPADAASPAYQFITWHDVYAYMRTKGVKVSEGLSCVQLRVCICCRKLVMNFSPIYQW